jgi:hypothetical protein
VLAETPDPRRIWNHRHLKRNKKRAEKRNPNRAKANREDTKQKRTK